MTQRAASHHTLNKGLHQHAHKMSQHMAKKLSFKPDPTPLANEQSFMDIIKNIPLIARLLQKINSAARSATGFILLNNNNSDLLLSAATGMKLIGLILNIIDFLRIPLLYLVHAIARKKPPITVSNNVEWLYSAVLLGLVISTFAAPIAAPYIGIVMASMGLTWGLMTLIKTVYQPYDIKKQVIAIEDKINEQTIELQELLKETMRLESLWDKSTSNNGRCSLLTQLTALDRLFDITYAKNKEALQSLHDQKAMLEDKLNVSHTDTKITAIMDKGLSISLSCAAVVGATLCLSFLPTGLIILSASATIGALYFLTRLLSLVIEWATKKTSTSAISNVGNACPSSDASPSLDKPPLITEYPAAEGHFTTTASTKSHPSHHCYSFFPGETKEAKLNLMPKRMIEPENEKENQYGYQT